MSIAAAAAAAAGLMIAWSPWNSGASPGVRPRPGWVFHERDVFYGVPRAGAGRYVREVTDTWTLVGIDCTQRRVSPVRAAPDAGLEASGSSAPDVVDVYDSRSNTIFRDTGCLEVQTLVDAPEQYRSDLKSGRLTLAGKRREGGRTLFRLTSADGDVYYVDSKTFVPVKIVSPHGPPLTQRGNRTYDCEEFIDPEHPATTVTIHITAFEFLPPTAANLNQLSTVSQHPTAKVVSASAMPERVREATRSRCGRVPQMRP